jgi:hypothetical protein
MARDQVCPSSPLTPLSRYSSDLLCAACLRASRGAGTAMDAAGTGSPRCRRGGFGLVSDEPPGEDASGAPPAVHRCDDLTMGLGTDPACVKAARDHTAAVLAAWGLNGHIPNATLVVSELVANVLRGHDVMCLVADVSDRSPVLTETDCAAETGRGLHLVAAHSLRWDWAQRPIGRANGFGRCYYPQRRHHDDTIGVLFPRHDKGVPVSSDDPLKGFRPDVPSPARMYDYYLGGKDHYPADREAAEKVIATMPPGVIRTAARQNRGFLGRAVGYLARRCRHPPVPRHRRRTSDHGLGPRDRHGHRPREPHRLRRQRPLHVGLCARRARPQ